MIWKLAVGLVLSAFFLWLSLRDAQLADVWSAVGDADYRWMVPMVALTLLSFLLRAWRWQLLLTAAQRVRYWSLLQATFIGFMGNNVLPARLGELLRVQAIRTGAGVSRSAALGSLVMERILDISMLLVFFVFVLLAGKIPAEVQSWGKYLAAALVPALLAVIVFRFRPDPFLAVAARVVPGRVRARVLEMAKNFHSGLGALESGSALGASALLSIPMWGCLVGVVICGFRSLSLDLPPDAGIITLVVMAIGTMVPSAPGFIGTLQYAGTLALTQYQVDPSLALTFTLIYHASQWFPVTAIGLVFFLQQHLSFEQLRGLETPAKSADRPGGEGL
jgi:hypothetical protein